MNNPERDFSPEALTQVKDIPEFSGGYEDITDCEAFAVDDPEIADPDDAISIQDYGKFYRLGVHISLVSWFIGSGTPLDKEAMERAISVYIPGKNIYMFPEELIREKLSLSDRRISPVLSLFADIDDDGTLIRVEIKLAQIRLTARFSYQELAALLKTEPRIRQLYFLSLVLSERRAMAGGNLIPIPYLKVCDSGGEMLFEKVNPESPEQLMITEPMILYNHLLSKFLVNNNAPGAFRHQPEPHGRPPSPHNPLYPVKALYALKKSHLSPDPKPHKGLGFSSYLQ
ncbi:MAG: RNB domain-containing ribonuclease, partial [Candidatus Hydrothermia bacterium]